MTATAQVHRFRDHVAAYLSGGQTQYMTAAEAREIAAALIRAADSCDTETFAKSTCGTAIIKLSGKEG